jgi:hypothetical protein
LQKFEPQIDSVQTIVSNYSADGDSLRRARQTSAMRTMCAIAYEKPPPP